MTERVAIIGVGSTGYRCVTPEVSYKELTYNAAVQAYDDAGIDPRRDVDSFVTVAEDFIEGTSIFDEYTPDQLGAALRPMQTICGDGLHGLATAAMLIRTGLAGVVVVEGHSKASNLLTMPGVVYYAQDPILNRPLQLNTEFVAGMDMNRYLFDTETTLEQCASVVVKNRAAALANPRAAYAARLRVDDVLAGPRLAWPLGRREVAQPADGAVVMVLASETRARELKADPVWILGVGWCNGASALESREWGEADYVARAAGMAYRQAGVRRPAEAFDLAEIDDTYAFKELQHLEALGLCSPGMAGEMTERGATARDGDLPVNVSGGSLGMGHLLEATGLTRAYEAVLQLRGTAGKAQLDKAGTAVVQSWRGVPTTSAAVAVLAR